MPQMMPMNWIMMFIILVCLLLMIMITTFTITKQLPQEKNLTFNKHHQWMW